MSARRLPPIAKRCWPNRGFERACPPGFHLGPEGGRYLSYPIWVLATPVIYPISTLPRWAQHLAFLNPMATVVTSYRDCLAGRPIDGFLMWPSFVVAALYLCFGVWFFRKLESRLADIL